MKTKEITNRFGIKQKLINMTIEEMKSNTVVDKTNFHDCTIANWKECMINFIPDYKSGSGSEYMFTDSGVYRRSNHWLFGVNTCTWLLDGVESDKDTIAFCSYNDFKKYSSKRDENNRLINDYMKLHENIKTMLIDNEMVLIHTIGNII